MLVFFLILTNSYSALSAVTLQGFAARNSAMGVTDISRHDMILSGLNLIKQAISLHDEELRLVVANRRFQQMFSLPDALVAPGAEFRDIVMYLTEQGEYGAGR